MSTAVDKLFQEALALPDGLRKRLARLLVGSLEEAQLSVEWRKEIARRLERIERGEAVLLDAEQHADAMAAKYDF